MGHSPHFNVEIPKIYENIVDIDIEINNYNNFRKALINFLDTYPAINLQVFKSIAYKLYYKNDPLLLRNIHLTIYIKI